MAFVFQYGSNMSVTRLNGEDRLRGDAKLICVARTIERFDLMFTVWSKSNDCAAADLVAGDSGRSIYGIVYEIPDFLLSRDTARPQNRKSLDAIEGEGSNYVRATIDLITNDGSTVRAITYLVKNRKTDLKTSYAYVRHILNGLQEHNIPAEYCQLRRYLGHEFSRFLNDSRFLDSLDGHLEFEGPEQGRKATVMKRLREIAALA